VTQPNSPALEKAGQKLGGKGLGSRAYRGDHRIVDEDGSAHRRDDEIEKGSAPIAQRFVGQPFENDRDQGAAAGGEKKGESEGQPEQRQREEAEIGAQHDDAAVREVRKVHDRVHERVADRHESVDRANG
jgi:hypothetical protein